MAPPRVLPEVGMLPIHQGARVRQRLPLRARRGHRGAERPAPPFAFAIGTRRRRGRADHLQADPARRVDEASTTRTAARRSCRNGLRALAALISAGASDKAGDARSIVEISTTAGLRTLRLTSLTARATSSRPTWASLRADVRQTLSAAGETVRRPS